MRAATVRFARMANPLERLERDLAAAVGAAVTLERPRDPAHGDYATNVALRTAAARGRKPIELAEEMRDAVTAAVPAVARATVAPPGFLNIEMKPEWFGGVVADVLAAGSGFGAAEPDPRAERIQVELVSANPTGPLTVASARNAAYGDAVARLLSFAGHEVEREFYVNDLGEQIERFRASVAARARGEEPPEEGYHGAYVAELADGGDPVETMLARIRASLDRFRVHVESWVRQSSVERDLEATLAELPLYDGEGAKWLPTSRWGDDKDRVVVRADGRPTYFAADLAYLRHKLERGFDRLVYVLGADHHGYVGRLRAAAAALGHDPDAVEVLIYQLVHLTEGGEARKVSKRRGDVVFLEELLEEIGVDAARWYLVSRGHEQTIEIDVDLARERTEKNPVYYVQYAHARIAGILRNAGDRAVGSEPPLEPAREERELVKRLADFPLVVAEATERRAPHSIPTYAIRLADDFHRFYHHHRVLESDAEAFRLGLCRATQAVIARALDLVGVEAPERM